MLDRAPVLTYVTLDAARNISNNSITVYGMIFANSTAGTLTVTAQNSADATIFTVEVPANSTVTFETVWLADSGLGFATNGDADMTVAVFHTQDGS